jgi:hypothetical protein
MSFDPIETKRPSTRGADVSISLRRRDGGKEPRIYISISTDLAEALGWQHGDYVTAHIGKMQDAGKIRIAPINAGLGGTGIKLATRGAGVRRVTVRIDPWFDYRGMRLPACPCRYKGDKAHGFLDVDLPSEIAAMPTLKRVA